MAVAKLSIIIPVYNEARSIKEILEKVKNQDTGIEKEIIVVDDCSTDGTRQILKEQKKDKSLKVIFQNKNGGKGTAVRAGLANATGNILLIQDADLEYDPAEYPLLLRPIIEGKAQVVYGSRFKSGSGHLKENNHPTYIIHLLGNKFLTILTNLLYFSSLTDMETCYKVFTRKVYEGILPLNATRFDLEPEITAKILKKKFRIKEVPISYYSRDFLEGKKITWKDGLKAMYCLIKYRIFD